MKKLIAVFVVGLCAQAFAQFGSYPQVSDLRETDLFLISRSNSPSAKLSRNVSYGFLTNELSSLLGGGAGLVDGDYGDIVVSGSGTAMAIDETAVEGKLDLPDLQGSVTDSQVPNTITIDLATLATTATTANAGDSATGFFSSGQIGPAQGGTGADTSGYTTGVLGYVAGVMTDLDSFSEWLTVFGVTGTPDGTKFVRDDGTLAVPSGGSGDPVLFNTTAVGDGSGVDFKDVTATASVAGTSWGLNTTPTPDHASNTVSVASATIAGVVTANAQTLGGMKSLPGGLNVTNAHAYFSGAINRPWETISASDIDADTGNRFTKTLSANLTATISNMDDGDSFDLRIVQNGTGGFTVTVPSSISVNGTNQTAGTSLDVNTNANAISYYVVRRVGSAYEISGPDTTSSVPLTKFATGTISSAEVFAQTTDESGNGVILASTGGASTNQTLVTPTITTSVDVNGNIDDVSGFIEQAEQSDPSTPSSGFGRWFVSSTGKPSFRDDAGTVSDLSALGGGGEGSGTVHSGGSLTTDNAIVRVDGTTGTNVQSSAFIIDDNGGISTTATLGGNPALAANGLTIGTTGIIFEGSTADGIELLLTSEDPTSSDKTVSIPALTGRLVLEDNTTGLTNKSISGANNTITFTDWMQFTSPHFADGTGCTIVTNSYAAASWGQAVFSGSAETNANYAWYRVGWCPRDNDTAVEWVLKDLAVKVAGTDADALTLDFAFYCPADSAAAEPTAWSSFGTFIRASKTPSSPAANDVFYFADITLTGWSAGVTAGRSLYIGIARLNTTNDDAVTLENGAIEYMRSK